MKVLILASLKPETGNFSTASRIQRCLNGPNIDCLLHCISCFRDSSSVKSFVNSRDVQCVLGVHAWRAGKLMLDCPVPFAVIFGGTDLNEHHKDQGKLKIMSEVTEKARYLVAFSSPMRKQAMALWPKIEQKIIMQPQAVSVEPSEFKLHHHLRKVTSKCYSNQEQYSLRRSFSNGYSSNLLVFLLVAGLRPVKDPLFLATAISEWHKEDHRVFLVIVGPELDTEFAGVVKSTVQRLPGVLLIPPVPTRDLHAAMQNSFAVVNSSTSEGMASAILEAMELGVPVIARNIPANSAVISHGESGLLFDTSQEFLTLAKRLMNSPSLRTYITSNAKKYVAKHHSIDEERSTYISLVKELVAS